MCRVREQRLHMPLTSRGVHAVAHSPEAPFAESHGGCYIVAHAVEGVPYTAACMIMKSFTRSNARRAHTMLWRRIDTPGHDACTVAQTGSGWCVSGIAVFQSGKKPAHLSYTVDCSAEWITQRAVVDGVIGTTSYHARIVRSLRGKWKLNGAWQPLLDGCDDLDLAFTPATNTIALRRLALSGTNPAGDGRRTLMTTNRSAATSVGAKRNATQRLSTVRSATARTTTVRSATDLTATTRTTNRNATRSHFHIRETAAVRAAWLNPEGNEFSVLEQEYSRISRTEYRYHAPRFDFHAKITVNTHNIVTNYPGLWTAES